METIVLERDGAVATVRLNRPNVLNALNLRMLDELAATFAQLDADAAVRAVILTGTGPKAFAAGADIAELNALPSARAAEAQALKGQALTRAIERMQAPVIAAVNGFALGGGCELAMACDIRIASENARFGQPEVNLGLLPGYGGTQRTARLVGEGMAMYLCLTGEMIDAQEALRAGLVQRVVAFDDLATEANRIAALIASKAPLAVAAAKRAVAAAGSLALDDGLAVEAMLFGRMVTTDDFREGSGAFLDKRKPDFKGR
ncbi:MAG TPA: enoyl-CoA hydratase-related protein [Candidatus Elarobacter sp.]|jgi:enoyl-CoA hydratase|nr:enoyl-CoA hydratase-related protein [Candidatus Elarobacter sp.]